MSDDYKVNKSKLSFKGETKTKKKKRKAEKPLEEEEDVNANADGWVFVKALTDLGGPLFLTFSSDPPTSLSVDDKSRVVMRPLESDSSSSSTTTPLTLDQAEPTVIQQVFVATMLPDSDRLTLKASNGRYLSSDKFGIVSAETEAIGMQEEWTAIIKPEENGGIALQNHYGKFLSVDEVAAAAGSSTGFQIRADSDVIGYCELFQAKIQAKNRKKAKKSTEVKIATKDYEFEQSRKFQTWNHGRVVVSERDVRELHQAKKEGRFSEALLDRREKVKSDRYCK